MSFVQAGAVRLEYFEAGGGPRTAVLIHGASSSARIWHAVQQHLVRAGIRTLAISMRGAGGSDQPEGDEGYTPSQYAQDLAAAVDELALDRFTLVGHSLGVSTVTNFVRDHRRRVQALVLMAGGALLAREASPPPGERQRDRERWEPHHRGLPEDVRDALWEDIGNNPPQRMRGQALARPDLTPVLASMPVHTLVVSGDADETVPPEATLRGYLALPEELRHLHVFLDVGHFPNAQIPDRLAGVFQRFIEAHVSVEAST